MLVSVAISIPDLYTSALAAVEDTKDDPALTSVVHAATANICLGLGLPWTIMTARSALTIGREETQEITFALVLLLACSLISVVVILLKRSCQGGELGGRCSLPSAIFLFTLWFAFHLGCVLHSYDVIGPFFTPYVET